MDQATYEGAINRLIAAAELVASGASQEQRLNALQMVAFFRLRQASFGTQGVPRISNEELFNETATAALTMAGRKEFLAAAALLDQARTLVGG
ncbi:hypothetical protein LMG28688_05377 [Paraburkholderia caffeinitolerans]|uniref:Uncharacterized protein n=1 Tax=Paraburkholderia caffeinitolerans TaxID=1723730 RepID=A0A6J5GM82_9BURK|nr:hypothetical protein [Paraburkholderia caffeinitolerans]CAB3801554.1 hypothetical protein LMG28688_05377 [Paraburkholderia caffeinitolerans]